MSLSAISDIFSPSDILSETKLKPWWESIREYCVRGMVVIVLLIIYSVELTSLHCIPHKIESGTSACVKTLTNPETSFVNNVCYEQVEFYRKNFGYIALLMTVGIYFCYEWWLIIPFVKNKFATMRNIDDSLKELKLISEQIKNLALKPSKQMDFDSHHSDAEADTKSNVAVVRKACRSLWIQTEKKSYITLSYIGREIMALALIIVCISLISLYVSKTNDIDVIFSCDAGNTTLVAVGCKHFICSYQASTKVKFFVIMYLVALILQALILFCTLMAMRRFRITKDNELIIFFGKHSMELQEVEALQSIITEDNYKIMNHYIEKAFTVSDLDYVNIFSNLNKENEDRVLDHIETKIKDLETEARRHDRMIDDQLFATLSRYCHLNRLHRYYIQLHVAYYKRYGHDNSICRCIHFQSSPAIINHHVQTCFAMVTENPSSIYKQLLQVLAHALFLGEQITCIYLSEENISSLLDKAPCWNQDKAHIICQAFVQLMKYKVIDGQTVLQKILKHPRKNLLSPFVSQFICEYSESLKNCTITDDKKVCLISDTHAQKCSYKELSKLFLERKSYDRLFYLHAKYMSKFHCDYDNNDCGCKEVPFELRKEDQSYSSFLYGLVNTTSGRKDLVAKEETRRTVAEHFFYCAKQPSDIRNEMVTKSVFAFDIKRTEHFHDDIMMITFLLNLLIKYEYTAEIICSENLINQLRHLYSQWKYEEFIIVHLVFYKFKGIVNYEDKQCGCDQLDIKLRNIFHAFRLMSNMPDQYWKLIEHLLHFGKDENKRQVMFSAGGYRDITAVEYVVELNSSSSYKASMLRLLIKHGYSTKEECTETINSQMQCNLTVNNLEDAIRDLEERENEESSYENAENELSPLLGNQSIA